MWYWISNDDNLAECCHRPLLCPTFCILWILQTPYLISWQDGAGAAPNPIKFEQKAILTVQGAEAPPSCVRDIPFLITAHHWILSELCMSCVMECASYDIPCCAVSFIIRATDQLIHYILQVLFHVFHRVLAFSDGHSVGGLHVLFWSSVPLYVSASVD